MIAAEENQTPWSEVERVLSEKRDELLSQPRVDARVELAIGGLALPSGRENPRLVGALELSAQEQSLAHQQAINTREALRDCARLTGEVVESKAALRRLAGLLGEAKESNQHLAYVNSIQAVRDHLEHLSNQFGNIASRNPEAFYVVNSREFRRHQRQLASGRIAITEYVAEQIEDGVSALDSSRMLLLHGPTGSGKSEVALIIGRIFSGREPRVIRGHKDVSAREISGHDVLKRSERVKPIDIPDLIAAAQADFLVEHPDLSESERQAAREQIAAKFVQDNSVTESEFLLGYLYKAAMNGEALIIDEFNLINRSVFMGLNSILTKEDGELIDVPEDNHPPFPVKKGFCVILTGNLNTGQGAEYLDREEQDASTINRAVAIEYGFLPQTTEGAVLTAAARDKQLYQVMLASLSSGRPSRNHPELSPRIEDRVIVANLPGGARSLDKLWSLAKLSAITQLALEGKANRGSPFAHRRNGTDEDAVVSHALTPRVVVRVLEQWKSSGFAYELDHYVFKALVDLPLTALEKDYFYRQGQLQGFFETSGWPIVRDDGSNHLYSDVRSPRNRNRDLVSAVPGRVLVEQIYGTAPERDTWPSEIDHTRLTQQQMAALHLREQEAQGVLERVEELLRSTNFLAPAESLEAQSTETVE
jgi:MoxR-like ATPase